MKEVLPRRFRRGRDEQAAALPGGVPAGTPETPAPQSAAEPKRPRRLPGQKADESFARLPDLLIIDGGKGQLGVAVEGLQEFGLTGKVPGVGLAKQQEAIFLPGQSRPLLLAPRSQG